MVHMAEQKKIDSNKKQKTKQKQWFGNVNIELSVIAGSGVIFCNLSYTKGEQTIMVRHPPPPPH